MQIVINQLPNGSWIVSWINFIGQQKTRVLARIEDIQELFAEWKPITLKEEATNNG